MINNTTIIIGLILFGIGMIIWFLKIAIDFMEDNPYYENAYKFEQEVKKNDTH